MTEKEKRTAELEADIKGYKALAREYGLKGKQGEEYKHKAEALTKEAMKELKSLTQRTS